MASQSRIDTLRHCFEILQGKLKGRAVHFNPDPCQHVIILRPFRGGDQIHGLLVVLAHQSKSASSFHLTCLIALLTPCICMYWYVNHRYLKFIILGLFSMNYI